MLHRALAIALAIAALTPSTARGATVRTMVDGLDFPAGIAFDSGGTMYVTERSGTILRIPTGAAEPERLAEIQTTTAGESGLLGVAVSPDGQMLYAFATSSDGATNDVWTVPTAGGEPRVVIEGLPAGVYHNGGGVAFAPDGMLLVSNGESHDDQRAQDPDALGGKVYRYTPEGDVPHDNPFGGSPTFALGLRNPFGIAIDPFSGDPFVTENGPESHDEVNRVVARGNYGWPVVSGPAGGTDTDGLPGIYHDPLLDFADIIVPTGITFAPRDAPPEVRGDLFFGSFQEQVIRRVELDGTRTRATATEVVLESETPVIALAWGPEGLYFSTPDAIKLIPFAARGSRGTEPPDEARTTRPPGDQEEPRPTSGIVLVLLAIAVLGAGLAFAFLPRRRG